MASRKIIRDKSVTDWANYKKVAVPHAAILLKPEVNIDIGTWYLKQGLRRWRKYKHYRELALCQYNAGGSWAEKWAPKKIDEPIIDRISISSTKEYVRSIMKKYHNYTIRRAKQQKQKSDEQ